MYGRPTPGLMKAIRATREQHRSEQTVLGALASVKILGRGGEDDKWMAGIKPGPISHYCMLVDV